MSTSPTAPATGKFLRYSQLTVTSSKSGKFIDLSALRHRFEVRASDVETPNTMTVTVYNISATSQAQILQEYDGVELTVGYQYPTQVVGTIFSGDIKQFRYGRERDVDNFLTIMAADGDKAYNEGIQNQAFPKGTTDQQTLSSLCQNIGITPAESADGFLTTGGILPRGKVQFGMARLFARELAKKNDCRWSIQNGVLTLVPNTGYLPGTVVQINSATGMIGIPEQTDNGILIRCYIDSRIQVGQAVQINNADISQAQINSQFFPSYTSQYYPASISRDGMYRVLVVEHTGDTRGNDFYSELTCLNIDPTSPSTKSVLPQG